MFPLLIVVVGNGSVDPAVEMVVALADDDVVALADYILSVDEVDNSVQFVVAADEIDKSSVDTVLATSVHFRKLVNLLAYVVEVDSIVGRPLNFHRFVNFLVVDFGIVHVELGDAAWPMAQDLQVLV